MSTDKKLDRKLIAELESAYQKVYEKEAQLKELGRKEGNGALQYQTMSDVRDSEVRYRRLFETAQDGILLLNAESGAITDANPFLTEMLGYAREELIGKRLWEIGAFVDVKESKAAFEELQQEKYIRYEDLPLKTKEGQSREVEFVSNVYLVDGKKVIQCNIRDITERKHAERALRESEERYRRLFETAQDGILLLDAESGAITDANPFILTILGYSLQDMIGKRLWEIGAFVDVKDSKAAFEELQKKEYIRYEDLPLKTKEGQNREVEFVSNVYLVSGKKVIQCNIRDITERRHAELHLQESEDRYRRLVELSPNAVLVHSSGKLAYVNPAAVSLLGAHDASELLGRPIFDIVHPDYREAARLRVTTGLIENKMLPVIDEKFLRVDGAAIDVEVATLPFEYAGISAIQYVVRDMTEQKKLQQQLLQSQKNESIGTLAGGIAHDFNNILAIILGYTSLIEKSDSITPKLSERMAAIHQAVQRGATLVSQILTFARKAEISFEPLSLADQVQELISMLQQTFPKVITFKKIFPKDIPCILADRTQIHQALLNLCVNARDAMPHGGSIVLRAEKQTGKQLKEQFPTADQDSYICVSVTDTGEGMSEATRRRVFDPFFTTKEQGKGTGLGLSVVYGVVHTHQGFINVESELGHGTTFRLFFPVPNISEKPADPPQIETFETGGTETILLVEDEEHLLDLMRFLLESSGYKVFVAHDGAEAIEVYKKHRQEIALVLTDMGLPTMTGIEEYRKLKEIDPGVKVIFASGFFDPDVKSRLVKDGAKNFLQKPYLPDGILRILREVLDKKR